MNGIHFQNQYRNKQKKIHIQPNKYTVNFPKEYFKKHRDYVQEVSAVHEYAYYDEVNIIYRDDMEDGQFIFQDYLEDDYKSLFFGIFDGHNGKDVLIYLLQKFPTEYLKQYKENEGNVLKSLELTFEKINKDLEEDKEVQSYDTGSTGFVGIIRQEGDRKYLYYANIGDTVGYLYQKDFNNIEQLGYIHRLTDKEELERIKNAGGDTLYERVGGTLEMSRSFGDFRFKSQGIISTPYVNQIQITQEHNYMVVGSDGLIDYASKEEIQKIVQSGEDSNDIADKCLSKCIQNKSKDNISIMVIKFHP